MRRAAVLALVCAVGCGEPWSSAQRGLIAGRPARAGELPAVGAIASGSSRERLALLCTGTLVAPDVVLTAAHCTEGVATGPVRVFTRGALVGRAAPDDAVEVASVVPHPEFRLDPEAVGLRDGHDVELLLLAAPVLDAAPAILLRPGEAAWPEGVSVTLAGYGRTSSVSADEGQQQIATAAVREVAALEVRVGARPGEAQACYGDSGGPVFLEVGDGRGARLGGVSSRGYGLEPCADGSVAARIDAHFAWVAESMVAACASGARVSCEGGGAPAEAPPVIEEGGCSASGSAPGWAALVVALAWVRRGGRCAAPTLGARPGVLRRRPAIVRS